jgi:hypothetical protein
MMHADFSLAVVRFVYIVTGYVRTGPSFYFSCKFREYLLAFGSVCLVVMCPKNLRIKTYKTVLYSLIYGYCGEKLA